jgi:hypothetical protein
MWSNRQLFSIFLDTLTDLAVIQASCMVCDDAQYKGARIRMTQEFKLKVTTEAKRWIWEGKKYDRLFMESLIDTIKGKLCMNLERCVYFLCHRWLG